MRSVVHRADNGKRNLRRLPSRVHLGRGYVFEVVLVPQSYFKERGWTEDGELLDGYWESLLGRGEPVAGRIFVHDKLSRQQQWETYWHELVHVVNDVMAWDRSMSLAT